MPLPTPPDDRTAILTIPWKQRRTHLHFSCTLFIHLAVSETSVSKVCVTWHEDKLLVVPPPLPRLSICSSAAVLLDSDGWWVRTTLLFRAWKGFFLFQRQCQFWGSKWKLKLHWYFTSAAQRDLQPGSQCQTPPKTPPAPTNPQQIRTQTHRNIRQIQGF